MAATPDNPFDNILFWSVGLAFAGYVFNQLFAWVTGVENFNIYFISVTGGPDGWYAQFLIFLANAVEIYIQVATIACALFVLGIVYSLMRWRQIKKALKKRDADAKKAAVAKDSVKTNSKWLKVLNHVNSENPAEWRLAILEADVLLEEVLDAAHFQGETLGEKLKNAPSGSFKTVQFAWDAHKTRNAIAHEGADFLITQREAKRVIGLYEQVFKEFLFI